MLDARLKRSIRWLGDRTDPDLRADTTGWWRDAETLALLGPALAALFPEASPTVVVGPESHGSLLGPLVASHVGTGFVAIEKDPGRSADSDAWLEVMTPPDYRDRQLRLGMRKTLLQAGDRVLFVDDWVATGAQVEACRALVGRSGAQWVGAAVVVDGCERPQVRRAVDLRALVHVRDL
ncbi:phosphoribosyltransferase family protein [Cellulomonas sp. SLBN-39]|uniref:phosphoribosyltransferase family protein n=1 Tax=Cellulomonas sp. SLBN-39 TaxID=2768446 RepID=UPI00114E8F32|nr:phosphoribosyltransferase family protein [Cellulomonas sp. SLBN-39]TQL02589.1 adenine phosphoribosyltransferase [Cellulomonas sp. SLBN-39]